MILATANKDQPRVIGDPKANLWPNQRTAADGQPPLTEEEIEEHSCIRCCVCGQRVRPEDVAEHSRHCVLEPAPNLRLQLDKWCIASASMTPAEQRAFLHMRRTEELARVEALEADLAQRPTQLWWMSGRFGYVISSKWLREWRSFVGVGRPSAETRDRPPSPINNMDLFELDGSLRRGLREGVQLDYHVLEQPMWDFFVQVYGGGPPILRYNASGVLPALSDQQASFEGEWRDLRPDTGNGRVFDPYSGCGFDGEIRDGFLWRCTGKGLLRNGSHFEGNVVDSLPDGRGREVKPSGMVCEGNFQQGKLHGFGRVTDTQGNIEEGEWDEGILTGI
mmetsp:Transcript_46358/g.107063  ORF Transcript_46358/g.107063 Transcript_46358/m.107063 type:complete len:335 (-) Transcript_46358:215-1219(-)|eukprot:CAMPEP_0171138916 /NCGR_PEP_ID=MMETSP0766_2-20121228/135911_1 /TAXON_ID=439317 /ORGANISM="Gambierdiscus australes, Strain CAWD 149" /LENGTH=334 /DNA_ID=CAMNT_0011602559 /DNA_START=53 /DNA_END=1057 /DNA_ORIENTATION=-